MDSVLCELVAVVSNYSDYCIYFISPNRGSKKIQTITITTVLFFLVLLSLLLLVCYYLFSFCVAVLTTK